MGQILAVDYGTKFIGLAISDETKQIATTLPTIRVPRGRTPLAALQRELGKFQLDTIVLGLPRGLDNKPTTISKAVEQFGAELHKHSNIDVAYWNETYSSQQAEQVKIRKGSNNSHSHAARIILQEYLDHFNSGI